MKPRERIIAALEHRQPDRVPVDFGGNQSSIHMRAYKRLLEHLGMEDERPLYCDFIQHIAYPCEELLERFRVDTRYVRPPATLLPEDFQPEHEGHHVGVRDALGVFWGYDERGINDVSDLMYLDPVVHPLEDMKTVQEIHEYDWPDGNDRRPLKGVKEIAQDLRKNTNYAIVTPVIGCVFEYTTFMFGFTRALRYLKKKPELIVAAMEELLKYWTDYALAFLDEVGDNVDVVCINGDLAEQAGPIMDPALYEKIIKPIEQRLASAVKQKAKVMINYHSCGSVPAFLDHFADIGYDACNPVQVSAHDMEPCSLKSRFGNRITFWGAGCDSQHVLPFGTPDDVRAAVKKTMACLKPGGGYVAASIHNITAEVPPDNIVAMFDAFHEFGGYS